MSEHNSVNKAFDELLDLKGPVILVGQQLLKAASLDDGKKEIIFPPSYANPSEKKDDPPVYNIDPPYDPKDPLTHNNVCVLDSIPSQANRMEPLFADPPYDVLVPQYKVKFNDELPIVNITQIGHRIADAAFRGTSLRANIVAAFKEYSKGNAEKLARIGPTSLVFGVWDSRGTGVKVPRLINSIIRAFNVQPLKRSAQYVPPIKYDQEGMLPAGLEGKPADHGLADVPSTHKIGGIRVNGEIRRDLSLNLELLRDMHAPLSENDKKKVQEEYASKNPGQSQGELDKGVEKAIKTAQHEADLKLQRYILGLALLGFTASQKTYLRQGCQLLPNGDAKWKQFLANGKEISWTPPVDIEELATNAANAFGVTQPSAQPLVFDKGLLKASIDADAKKKAEKKAESAGDPTDNLKALVEGLDFKGKAGSKQFKENPSKKKLGPLLGEIASDASASADLKRIANEIQNLLTDALGADDRKAQMLAFFPASGEQSAITLDEPTADDTKEDQS